MCTGVLMVDAELGKRYCLPILLNEESFDYFGSLSYSVDAAGFDAYIKLHAQTLPPEVEIEASIGVVGPSAGMSYTTPTWTLWGYKLNADVNATAGLGVKGTLAAGLEVDTKKPSKIGAFFKLGGFCGPGGSLFCKLNVETDPNFNITQVYQDALKEDKIAQGIMEKMHTGQILLTSYESDYLDGFMEEVINHAQANAVRLNGM